MDDREKQNSGDRFQEGFIKKGGVNTEPSVPRPIEAPKGLGQNPQQHQMPQQPVDVDKDK